MDETYYPPRLSGFFIFLLSFIIFLSSVTLLLFNPSQKSSAVTLAITPKVSTTWKTYNTKANYNLTPEIIKSLPALTPGEIEINYPEAWFVQDNFGPRISQANPKVASPGVWLTKPNLSSLSPSAPDAPTQNVVMIEFYIKTIPASHTPASITLYEMINSFYREFGFGDSPQFNLLVKEGLVGGLPAQFQYRTLEEADDPQNSFPERILVAISPTTVLDIELNFFYYGGDPTYLKSTIREINEVINRLKIIRGSPDWKTYTNTYLGYSLKYPSDWELHPDVSTYLSSSSGLGIDFKEEYFNPKLSTFKENADFWLTYYLSSTAELGNAQDKIIKEESIPLGGTTAIKNTISYRFSDMKSTGTAIWIYAPLTGDHLLSIKYYSDTSNPQELDLYNQILSTLKFFLVSPTPSPSPSPTPFPFAANWQTCTNSVYHFSIRYPLSYSLDTTTCNFSPAFDPDLPNTDLLKKEYVLNITANTTASTLTDWISQKNICPVSPSEPFCEPIVAGVISDSLQITAINRHYASIDTLVKKDNLLLDFSLGAREPNTPISPQVLNQYRQILSTIKFTD